MKYRWGNKGSWFLSAMILLFIALGFYTQLSKAGYDRMYTVSEGRLSWCPEGE